MQGDLTQAQALVEAILNVLADYPLAGLGEPFYVYLTCYRVLDTTHDPRATTVLQTALRLLHQYADSITDEGLRRSFLENVATHRELLAAATGVRAVAFSSPAA